jgi:hypothetical protein
MLSDRHRILELALESLEYKKKQIDQEIVEIAREIKGSPKASAASAPAAKAAASRGGRKRPQFSKEEKLRRSARMKAYWDNWRKMKAK